MGSANYPLALSLSGTVSQRPQRQVEYVTDSDESVPVLEFLATELADPLHALLVVGGGVLLVVGIAGYLTVRPARYDVAVFRATMREYSDLVPWILRLSVGLPLVGAGFAGYFFSPAVPPIVPLVVAPSRLFQLAVGMSLLFGLASRPAAVLGLAVYAVSVPFLPDLLLASEFVGGFLAIALLGSGRPSADQVLRRIAAVEGSVYDRIPPVHRLGERLERRLAPSRRYAPTIVRIALGLNFLYLGLTQKLLDPGPALAVVEKYALTAVVPISPGMWVVGAGLVEVALGTLLVVGLLTRGVAAVALVLFTVTLFGLPDDPVLAHVSLFGLSSALLVTGSGPLSIDARFLAAGEPGEGNDSGAGSGAGDG